MVFRNSNLEVADCALGEGLNPAPLYLGGHALAENADIRAVSQSLIYSLKICTPLLRSFPLTITVAARNSMSCNSPRIKPFKDS